MIKLKESKNKSQQQALHMKSHEHTQSMCTYYTFAQMPLFWQRDVILGLPKPLTYKINNQFSIYQKQYFLLFISGVELINIWCHKIRLLSSIRKKRKSTTNKEFILSFPRASDGLIALKQADARNNLSLSTFQHKGKNYFN